MSYVCLEGRSEGYLSFVQPLLAVGHFTPDDGSDVLDDHGALLYVSGRVQTKTLHTHTHTRYKTTNRQTSQSDKDSCV